MQTKLQQAKSTDLIWYLGKQGYNPVESPRESDRRAYYLSPLHAENNASFNVNKLTNRYVDWGLDNSYGDIIDFVEAHDNCTTSEAIDKILGNDLLHTYRKPKIDMVHQPIAIEVTKEYQAIEIPYLVNYLKERCITENIYNKYLVHVDYVFGNTPWSTHYGLGFKNDKGGYEIRSPHWKGGTSPKTVTTIKSKYSNKINLFEGFFDYLSALVYYDTDIFDNDTIILNSLSFVHFISEYIMNTDEVNVFFDADAAGDDKFDYLSSQGINTLDQRGIYEGFNDFNEFLVNTQ